LKTARLKWLFLRGAKAKFTKEMILDERVVHRRINVPGLPRKFAQYKKQLKQVSRPRFLIVRNPYSRLLSAFLDKIVSSRKSGWLLKAGFKKTDRLNATAEDFSIFVNRLYNRLKTGKRNDEHFTSVHHPSADKSFSGCLLGYGFQYDFILKLEDMSNWFGDFLHMTGLTEVAANGWGKGEEFGGPVRLRSFPELSFVHEASPC